MATYFETSDGVRIAYENKGEGEAVLLVHGWGSTKRFWKDIAPRLSEKFRVIAIDLRGHGESSKDPNVDFSLPRLAKDILELANCLELGKFVYIGHSLGGVLGLYMGINYGEKLDALITITAPYELKSSFNGFTFRIVKFLLKRNRKLAGVILTPRLFSNSKNNKELIDFVRKESAKVPVGILIKTAEENKDVDLLDQLKNIKVPVLLISAKEDKIVKEDMVRKMIREIPNSTHIEIAEGGHNIILERPDEVLIAIIDFIENRVIKKNIQGV